MGNSFTKTREDENLDAKVDEGQVVPLKDGVYPNAPQDWDLQVVRRLIKERRMAPFYRGLSECDEISQIQCPTPRTASGAPSRRPSVGPEGSTGNTGREGSPWPPSRRASHDRQPSSASSSTFTLKGKRSVSVSSQMVAQEASSLIRAEELYKYPVECPICFLYYPANVNYSRCCDQPICTECFVQIKRPESTLEPASCPFCVESNFGILYHPPGSPEYTAKLREAHPEAFPVNNDSSSQAAAGDGATGQGGDAPTLTSSEKNKRRQSVSHQSSLVVTSDELRPDWLRKQQQLALVRAANQRRMTIPIAQHGGASARRRIYSLDTEGDLSGAAAAAAALVESMTGMSNGSGSSRTRRPGNDAVSQRRRTRRDRGADFGVNYLEAVRHMGADLEELMIMEAIRRSLQEAESNNAAPGTNRQETPERGVVESPTLLDQSQGPPVATESSVAATGPSAGTATAGGDDQRAGIGDGVDQAEARAEGAGRDGEGGSGLTDVTGDVDASHSRLG